MTCILLFLGLILAILAFFGSKGKTPTNDDDQW